MKKGKDSKEFYNFLVRKIIQWGTSTQSCSHFNELVNSGVDDSLHCGAMILQVGAMHMLVKTRCTCSCSMMLMMHVSTTRLPTCWVSDCEGNYRQRRTCVASRLLTTKIPSMLLVTITWLQHTWCPRFRHGTFGYGLTTSPTREVEYEYGNFHATTC
jgi:hypothetical protein